ncbi:hypothetical protein [Variovorax sp.]|uniref:hypothetical protein n=1 Tax=Variovorax sp. TaxID=1871043 RepID=UPI004037EB4C
MLEAFTSLTRKFGVSKKSSEADDIPYNAKSRVGDISSCLAADLESNENLNVVSNACLPSIGNGFQIYTRREIGIRLFAFGVPPSSGINFIGTASVSREQRLIGDVVDRHWTLHDRSVLYIEQFGASESASPAVNSAAIEKAISALRSGWSLRQKTWLISVNTIIITNAIDRANIKLNLRYEGSTEGLPVMYLTGLTRSILDISIDCNDKSTYGLRLQNCTGSVVPATAVVKNIFATAYQAAAIFTRDSDQMRLLPTIQNIRSDGTKVVRGIMISDQTIPKNTTLIAPRIDGVFNPVGSLVDDADGVYAEHSNRDHEGGLRFVNGVYRNCSKRNIKCSMANPTIEQNAGDNDLVTVMYSFVSVYNDHCGYVGENTFVCTGAGGVTYGIEYGAPGQVMTFRVENNSLKSNVSVGSSCGIRVIGKIASGQITVGEIVGFRSLMNQSLAAVHTGQSLVISDGKFNGLGLATGNGIGLQGGYSRLRVTGIQAVDAVSKAYFVANVNLAAGIAEVFGNKQSYGLGRCQARQLTGFDLGSTAINSDPRYEGGRAILRRDSVPSSGAWVTGDKVERTAPSAGSAKGWTRVTTGTGNVLGRDWVSDERP